MKPNVLFAPLCQVLMIDNPYVLATITFCELDSRSEQKEPNRVVTRAYKAGY